jgi:hypothetical protein
MSEGSELLARIRAMRDQLDGIDRLLRAIGGSKAQARVIADLRDRTNDLANEVKRERREG